MSARLRMTRWSDRHGRLAVRVLCYARRRREAYLWRELRRGGAPAYLVAKDTGSTQSYGTWRDAFTAARAHVGVAR